MQVEVVPIPVTRYRRGVKGQLPKVPMCKVVKVKYEPDNDQVGYQSKGLQSDPLEAAILFDRLHSACHESRRNQLQGLFPKLYEAWVRALQGFAPMTPYVVVREVIEPLAPASAPVYTCEQYPPVMLGTALRTFNSINNNRESARIEERQWKRNRNPRMIVYPNPYSQK